ncbi:MAG: NAD(P)/FAD-dependent oxidoreductase [Parvibaculaceae bacterium]
MRNVTSAIEHSLYRARTPEGADCPELEGTVSADVVIIGAGFTGLSAALELAEKGTSVVVVEANDIGWGASGRNGGQVNPGLKYDPSELVAKFGEERGGRLVAFVDKAPASVFSLIERLKIDCAAVNAGTIRAVNAKGDPAPLERYMRDWTDRGAPVELVKGDRLAALTGTEEYVFAVVDRRGGQLNPLAYARGLADAVIRRGGAIYVNSRVVGMKMDGSRRLVATARGAVRAERVIVATNGYSDDLVPRLRRSVVPVYTGIIATDPLPPELRKTILPGRQVLYESSWRVIYYRLDHEGRFLMGGPSPQRDAGRSDDYSRLTTLAAKLYPGLSRATWSHYWNGQVALTRDHLPHLHAPEPDVTVALGYNGRGIAMATALGALAARRAAGMSADDLDLPLSPIETYPFHAMWRLGVAVRRGYGALREKMGPVS